MNNLWSIITLVTWVAGIQVTLGLRGASPLLQSTQSARRFEGFSYEHRYDSRSFRSLSATRRSNDCSSKTYPKEGSTITPLVLTNPVEDLVWVSDSNAKVYVTTFRHSGYPGGPLWEGTVTESNTTEWKELTETLKGAIVAEGESATFVDDDLGVVSVRKSPIDSNVVFFQGYGEWHWVSSDGGATMQAVKSPGMSRGAYELIKFHPRQSKWILMRTVREACDVDVQSVDCLYDLLVSKDLGQSWKNITETSQGHLHGVRDFEWGAKISHFNGRETKDDDIFVTGYPGSLAKKGMDPGWDDSLQFFFSEDYFVRAPKLMVQCGNLFEIISDRMFLAVSSECPVDPKGNPRKSGSGTIKNRSVTMYVSVHGGEFVEACLPANLEDDGYNLIHTHDEQGVFVLADHAEPGSKGPMLDSPSADAYAPAYNASLHTLSLGMVYRRSFITDFARVEGLPGYYIANQIDLSSIHGSFDRSFLKTRHSPTGGSQWNLISPPQSFRHSQCNACTPGTPIDSCSLHLHGPTSWFSPEGPHPNFYSLPSAPGVMLATGNVGSHLDFHPDADCTFMSRDGGRTWFDIADYTAIYEMSPSGGTIVMASHRSEGPTDEIKFSLDQGSCFQTINLPQAMLVENIRVASEGETNTFYVIGAACTKSSSHPSCTFDGGSNPPGMMYAIDLPSIVGNDWAECNQDEGSKDYEIWDFGGDCILGSKRTIKRKIGTFCANPSSWKAKIEETEKCQCAESDVECEFGYEKTSNNTCTAMKDVSVESACPRLLNSDYKASKSHLRLVHDNTCSGVNDIIPDTNGKGGAKGSSKAGDDSSGHCSGGGSTMKSMLICLIILGGILVAVGFAWSQCLTGEQQQAILHKLEPLIRVLEAGFELVLGAVVEVYDWVRAKFGRLPSMSGARDQDARGYYEALSGSPGLDLDPEDQTDSPNPIR